MLGEDRLIVYGVPRDVAGAFDERVPEEIVPEERVPEEIVGRDTDGDDDRLGELGVWLLHDPVEGERRMITGDVLRVLLLEPVLEDDGLRIADVLGDDEFGRMITGLERVTLGVEPELLTEEELGELGLRVMLGLRVTIVGVERDEREPDDDGLYDREGVERVTREGVLLAEEDEEEERRGVATARERLTDGARELRLIDGARELRDELEL